MRRSRRDSSADASRSASSDRRIEASLRRSAQSRQHCATTAPLTSHRCSTKPATRHAQAELTTGAMIRGRLTGWRVSGERRAEGDERVRCTRVLGGAATSAATSSSRHPTSRPRSHDRRSSRRRRSGSTAERSRRSSVHRHCQLRLATSRTVSRLADDPLRVSDQRRRRLPIDAASCRDARPDQSPQVHAATSRRSSRPPNGWRVSGERRAEGDERVRCTRVLGGLTRASD